MLLLGTFMAIVMGVTGCGGHSHYDSSLSEAESVIESHPDSALYILDRIDEESLNRGEERARFSLLKTIALVKVDSMVTDTAVLRPALEHYLRKGTPNRKMQVLFYEGCIYENADEYTKALDCYLSAENVKGADDTLMLAKTLVAQALIHYKQYDADKFISLNMAAATLYAGTGHPDLELRSYLRALRGAIDSQNAERARALLEICRARIGKDADRDERLRGHLMSYLIFCDTTADLAKEVRYWEEHQPVPQAMKFILAKAHTRLGDGEAAIRYLDEVEVDPFLKDSMYYLNARTLALQAAGRDKEALETFQDYIGKMNEYHTLLFDQNLLSAENEYKLRLENSRRLQTRDRVIYCVVMAVLILLVLLGWKSYRYRLEEARRLAAEQEREASMLAEENIRLELERMVEERDRLLELKDSTPTQPAYAREAVLKRLDIVNCAIAMEITPGSSMAKQYKEWRSRIQNDKEGFVAWAYETLGVMYPRFVEYVESLGLTDEEKGIVSLYAVGLNGKEVGAYLNKKAIYQSTNIMRRKFNLTPDEAPNLGHYIRAKMAEMG